MGTFTPTESPDYPGFYISKTFPEVAINKKGEVLRLRDCIDPNSKIAGKRYGLIGDRSYGSLSVNKYRFVRTLNNEHGGKRMKTFVHRISAFAIKGKPPKLKQLVNHMDLDRSNNADDNLEYITHQANIQHEADRRTGLESYPLYLEW